MTGLGVGARIGSYEIVSSLGAGGMGEVYRARDSRLGRDVALELGVAGAVDLAHSACPEGGEDLVVPKTRAG